MIRRAVRDFIYEHVGKNMAIYKEEHNNYQKTNHGDIYIKLNDLQKQINDLHNYLGIHYSEPIVELKLIKAVKK